MNNETILKLIKSSSEEDVIIGLNFLCKRPRKNIVSFLRRLQIPGKIAYGYQPYYNTLNITIDQVCYIKRDHILLAYTDTSIYEVFSDYKANGVERWINKTI